MKLYNLTTDKIENVLTFIINDIEYIASKLQEVDLNTFDYYYIERTSPADKIYYDNIQTKSLIDNKYTVGYTSTEKPLVDVQKRMLKDLREVYENKALRPLVDTGLGYNVYGGQLDVIELKDAKDNAEQVIIDADDNEQTVNGVAYTAIADAIKLDRNNLRVQGKTKVSEVKALTTVSECITYEYEPYDYIVTQEDVIADPELVLGETLVRYTNNIKDW